MSRERRNANKDKVIGPMRSRSARHALLSPYGLTRLGDGMGIGRAGGGAERLRESFGFEVEAARGGFGRRYVCLAIINFAADTGTGVSYRAGNGASKPGLRWRGACQIMGRCCICCCCRSAAATPTPAPVSGQSFSLMLSETGSDKRSPCQRQLQDQRLRLVGPDWAASLSVRLSFSSLSEVETAT